MIPSLTIVGLAVGSILSVVAALIARRRSQELEVAREAAEAASRTKSQFLANVSHELRTPMNGILGMTELALGTPLTAGQRDYLETVKESAEGLLHILNDVLDFSKVNEGRLELERIDFSLRTVLDNVLKPLSVRACGKHLDLHVDIRPDVPDSLVGDPHRLRQILLNLVSNAIKFTEQGEVIVRVERDGNTESHAPSDPSSVALTFRVIDTGIGIPKEAQDNVFKEFAQADGSTTRRFGGTGLGLTISAQLVQLMGGQIAVDSRTGQGSEFRFSLALPVASTPVRPDLLPHPGELAGLRALIVDGNRSSRQILTDVLTAWGMLVTPTASATEAEGALAGGLGGETEEQAPFRIVLVDGNLGPAGIDLVASISDEPRLASARVVLLTAADRPQDGSLEQAGVDAHLVKPVTQPALLDTIRHQLVVRSTEDQQPAAPATTPVRAARQLSVLVAEDNPVNQKLALHLLRTRGHSAVVAENGRLALEAFRAQAFDLVLMDLQMPELDGFEVAAAIRTAERGTDQQVPIVALTAYALEGDRQRCLDAGMNGYVSKPIQPVELFEVIDKVIASRPQPSETAPSSLAPPPAASPEGATDVLDGEGLMTRLQQDRGMLHECTDMFLADYPDRLTTLQAAVQAGDADGIADVAHSLKGAIAIFSNGPAYAAARTLEQMGRTRALDDVERAYQTLDHELARLRAALEAFALKPVA